MVRAIHSIPRPQGTGRQAPSSPGERSAQIREDFATQSTYNSRAWPRAWRMLRTLGAGLCAQHIPSRAPQRLPLLLLHFPGGRARCQHPSPAAVQYQAPPCTQPAFPHPEWSQPTPPSEASTHKMAEDQEAHPSTLPKNSVNSQIKERKTTKGPKNPLAEADGGPSQDEKHANKKAISTKGTPSAQTCTVPVPRPAEEPGGTVESPRGKGVAVTAIYLDPPFAIL